MCWAGVSRRVPLVFGLTFGTRGLNLGISPVTTKLKEDRPYCMSHSCLLRMDLLDALTGLTHSSVLSNGPSLIPIKTNQPMICQTPMNNFNQLRPKNTSRSSLFSRISSVFCFVRFLSDG